MTGSLSLTGIGFPYADRPRKRFPSRPPEPQIPPDEPKVTARPEVLTTSAVTAWPGGSSATFTIPIGAAEAGRTVILMHAARGSNTTLTTLTANGADVSAVAATVTGASNNLRAHVFDPGMAASLDVAMTLGAAPTAFRLVALVCRNIAALTPFHTAASAATASATGETFTTIDLPDHGLVTMLSFSTSAVNDTAPIGVNDAVLNADGALAGYATTELRSAGRDVGVLYNTAASNRSVLALSFISPASEEVVRTGFDPLKVHGQIGARTMHVGMAGRIDLSEGHYGYDGVTYAIDPSGDALPAGLSLADGFIVGIPTATATASLVIALTRAATAESVLMPVSLTVAAASAVTNLASAAAIAQVGTPGTWAPTGTLEWTGTWGAPVANDQRFKSLSLAVTPLKTYRLTALVDTTGAVAPTGNYTLRVAHVNDNPPISQGLDDLTTFIGEVKIARGETRVVSFDFTPGRDTVYVQIGKFAYWFWNGTAWANTASEGVGDDTIVLRGLKVEELADTLPLGGVGVVDRVTRFGATFVFDKPRAVRRYITGDYALINAAPASDPAKIVAIYPTCHKFRADPARAYQGHGAHTNWGSTPIALGEPSQGFDPRAGGGSTNQLAYSHGKNRDPGSTGAPILWSSSSEGVQGSVDKALVRTQSEEVNFDGGKQSLLEQVPLTVVTADPGPDAFMPPTSVVAKAHKRLSDLVPGWLDLAPKLPRPAALAAYDATKLRYFMLRPYQIGTQNQPKERNVNARYNGREYGREQSQRWDEVMMALLTDPDQGGVSAVDREWLALQSIQHGVALDGRDQAGGVWVSTGGGSQNRKPFAVFAALAFNDAGMLSRVDAQQRLGYADDRYVEVVAAARIAPNYYPPNYNPAKDNDRPRAAYTPEMLGMPEWRNQNDTGSNYLGDGYRGISMTSSIGGYLFARKLTGGVAAWGKQATFDYADRHFGWITRRFPTGESTPVTASREMWLAYRAGGKPVAHYRNGLVENGSVARGSLTDNTGKVYASGAANPASDARDIPTMRAWPVGVATPLDLAAEEFNGYGQYADGAPTGYTITAALDADGAPITVPAWVSVTAAGVLTATPPDTALRFVEVSGANASGAATARVAIRGV